MVAPETPPVDSGKEKDIKSFSEKWYTKWVELFKSFLGTKDLEAIAKDLSEKKGSSAASRTNEVLGIIQGKEDDKKKNLLNTLVSALIQEDDEAVNRILDSTLHDDDKGLFKPLADQTKARKEKKVDPDKEKEEYDKLQKEVEARKGESIKIINKKLVSEKKDGLKKKIDRERQRIEEERKKRDEEPTEEWFKKSLLNAEVLLNEKVRNRKANPVEERVGREVIDTAKRVIGSYFESGTISERLTDEEKFFLQLYFYDGDNTSKSVKQRLLVKLINSTGEGTDTKKYLSDLASPRKAAEEVLSEERLKKLEQLVDQESGKGAGKYVSDLLKMMSGEGNPESMSANSLRYLNIEPKLYEKLNNELKGKLGISFDALVRDDELGIYRVSGDLNENQKKHLTALIFDRLAAEVRMAVDEGKDLRERQYEPLLRVYNTLTAIVGLDTAQKSEIKQKLNFEVISFMLFNSFQSEESKKMIAEMASHIGAESNIFTGMLRRKETFRITDAYGKEMEIGAFNIYDFAKIAGSKIINQEDRLAFGITKPASEVGRTYGTMMYASNKPEEKLLGRGIVTRRVIIDQYGQNAYDKLLRDYINVETGPVPLDAEKDFLDKIGKKYFDYHNGIYVYWGMTNQMADYVGNAHIDNSKLAPPAGIPESLWKNDMKLLYLFHENYHGVKNVDMLLQLRTAFNSMLVKEASEVWSWIINTEENPVTKVESIYTGLFGGKKSSHGVLVQQAFLGAMFEDETIHLGENNHKLHHKTKILEGIPVKTKKGLLVVDTMTRRRDWVTFNEKMREQAKGWDESVFEEMDFTFIAEKMKHLPRVSQTLLEGGKDPRLNKQKFFFLIDSMSDEFALFDNLSQKRGDDPMKYNLDYFANASKAGITLAQDITYANAIAFIAEAQKVSGVGKVGELAISILERVREKREAMGLWQTYIIPKIVDGKVVIDPGSYVGDLPGSYPLFELEERTVSFEDIRMHPEGVSIASLGGDPTGVDKEEIHYKYALDRMWQLNILTEEEYKHYVKEFFHEMKGWNSKKNPMSELWAHVSGKKLWEYWAAKFNVPEEILKKWIFEGGSEFFGLWWKYFNGTGAGHH